jgi:hypothetical protein
MAQATGARPASALSRMRVRTVESFTSDLVLEDNSQESTFSLSTSQQEDEQFKRPALPAVMKAERENDQLRKQVSDLHAQQRTDREQHAARMERQMAQQKESMEKQMAQQREESQKQMEQQKEIVDLLKQMRS